MLLRRVSQTQPAVDVWTQCLVVSSLTLFLFNEGSPCCKSEWRDAWSWDHKWKSQDHVLRTYWRDSQPSVNRQLFSYLSLLSSSEWDTQENPSEPRQGQDRLIVLGNAVEWKKQVARFNLMLIRLPLKYRSLSRSISASFLKLLEGLPRGGLLLL